MLSSEPPTQSLRIVSQCASTEEFVYRFRPFLAGDSLFIATGTPRQVGESLHVNLTLAGGEPVLSGSAEVVDAALSGSGAQHPGMTLRFHELDEQSQHTVAMLRDRSGEVPIIGGTGTSVPGEPPHCAIYSDSSELVAAEAMGVAATMRLPSAELEVQPPAPEVAPEDLVTTLRTGELARTAAEAAAMDPAMVTVPMAQQPLVSESDDELTAIDDQIAQAAGAVTELPAVIVDPSLGSLRADLTPMPPPRRAPSAPELVGAMRGPASEQTQIISLPSAPNQTRTAMITASIGAVLGLGAGYLIWGASPAEPETPAAAEAAPILLDPESASLEPGAVADENVACSLRITSVPEDAEVHRKGTHLGSTPYSGLLPCGETELTFKKARYEPLTELVALTPGESTELSVELERPRFEVEFLSKPPGATVRVNGEVVGETPLRHQLAGFEATTVVFSKNGFRRYSKRLTIKKARAIEAKLKPRRKGKKRRKRRR